MKKLKDYRNFHSLAQSKVKGSFDDLVDKIRADGVVVIGDGEQVEAAKKTLDALQTEYKVYGSSGLTDQIKEMTGETAKLNVFVGGKHLVGIEDFKEAAESTQLQKLINDAGTKHNGAVMHDVVYTIPWKYHVE